MSEIACLRLAVAACWLSSLMTMTLIGATFVAMGRAFGW